jgi:hypothetical protein
LVLMSFLIEKVRKIINATLTPIFYHPTSYPINRLLSVMDSGFCVYTASRCIYYYYILKLKIG